MIYHATPPPRTLDLLVANAAGPFEAWTFDDAEARRAAEAALAARGITAKLRSAYKPLVQFFLEEARTGFTAATSVGRGIKARSRTGSCSKPIRWPRCSLTRRSALKRARKAWPITSPSPIPKARGTHRLRAKPPA